ncbi:MAG: TolC family outer membrane protein, partial [Gammaproteobacteria bacterium]
LNLRNLFWGLAAFFWLPHAAAITIEQAVQQALSSNPEVRSAESEVRAAGHDVRNARAGYFPSLDLNVRYGREHTNIKQLSISGNDADDLWRRESGVSFSQLLWDGNATRSEVARRVALLNGAEHSLNDTRNAMAFRATEVYLDVLRNRELLSLARTNVDSHMKTLDNVRAKLDSGIGNRADVNQATARLALARSTVTAREGAVLEAEARYERVVGEHAPAELAAPVAQPSGMVNEGMIEDEQLRASTDNAQQSALSSHPAAQQSEALVAAADAVLEGSASGYHPQLNLEGALNRDNNISGVRGNRNSDTVMVVARWNLFRGGADRAEQLAAAERKVAAQDQLDDARRRIAENVAIAYQARATSESRLVHLQAHVDASQGTLDSYRAQFELNRRTLLDVLNAENELFNARSNLVFGKFDDLINIYFVDASKGDLAGAFGGSGTR